MQLISDKISFLKPFWFMQPWIDKLLTEYNQSIVCFHIAEKPSEFFPYLITYLSGVTLALRGDNERKMGEGEEEEEGGGGGKRQCKHDTGGSNCWSQWFTQGSFILLYWVVDTFFLACNKLI